MPPPSSARSSPPASWSANSTSRASSTSSPGSAPIPARSSPAAPAACRSARPARSPPAATACRSRRDLRRLRRLRRGLPDRRRHLCAAAGRRPRLARLRALPAPMPRPADRRGAAAARRGPWRAADRRLARHGDGLPARVLPLAVNETSQIGPAILAAAFAWGAGAVRVLLPARPGHDGTGLAPHLALTAACWTPSATARTRPRDRDRRPVHPRGACRAARPVPAPRAGQLPAAAGGARPLQALDELHRTAPAPVDAAAAGARPLRRGGARGRRLHPLPRLHHGLPDRRLRRQSGDAAAALPGGCPACNAASASPPARSR